MKTEYFSNTIHNKFHKYFSGKVKHPPYLFCLLSLLHLRC